MAEPVKHARTRSVLLWAGLFALALALRVFRLDEQSLFWDDYNGLVGLAEPGFVDSILAARDVNPEGMPLYHIVQYLFRGLIGDSPLAMRGLSIAIGLATLPFVYAAASAAFGRSAGMLAAFLFAVSPQHIYHDQSIRNYPLAVLLATAAVWALIRTQQGGGRRFLALNLLLNAALVWTQLLGVFAVAAQGAALLLAAPRHVRRWGGWALCQGLMLAPVTLWVLTMPHVPEYGYWHFHAPGLWQVASNICAMDNLPNSGEICPAGASWRVALGPFASDSPLFSAGTVWVQTLIGAGCLLWAASWLAWRAASRPDDGKPRKTGADAALTLFALAVLPPVALALVSHAWRPMYYPRYFLYSTPCLYALMGGAWAALPRRPLRAAFLAALMVLYTLQLCLLLPGTTRTPWREAGERVLQEARPDDLVLVGGHGHAQKNLGLLTANMPPNGMTIATAHTVDAAVLKTAAALCPDAPEAARPVPESGAVHYVTCLEWGRARLDGLREGLALFGLDVRETTLPGGESMAVFRITRPAQGAPKPFPEACADYWHGLPDLARTVSGTDLGALLERAKVDTDRVRALRLMRLVQDDGNLPETWAEQTTMFAYFLLQEDAHDLSRQFLEAFLAETGHPTPDLMRTAHDALRAFREGRREDAVRHLGDLEASAREMRGDMGEIRMVSCLAGAAMLGALGKTDPAGRALTEAGENGARSLPAYSVIEPLAQGRTEESLAEMARFRATVPGSRDTFFRLLGLGPWNAPGAAAALCGAPSVP
jgi:hypothetical protein